jgi:hypothetical protein
MSGNIAQPLGEAALQAATIRIPRGRRANLLTLPYS